MAREILTARRFLVILLLIGALGAGLRLAHLYFIKGTAFYHFDETWTSSDMRANREWAQQIASGDWLDRNAYRPHFSWQDNVADPATWTRWFGPSTYYQPPLYIYLAALSIRGTGSPDALRLLQTLTGAVNVVLIGLLGRRVAGPAAGLIAALLTAGYAPFILYDSELLRGTFVITLNTLALLALLRAGRGIESGKKAGFILAGSLLGVTYLLDSAIVTFIPLAFVWALLTPAGGEGAEAGDGDTRPGPGSGASRTAGMPGQRGSLPWARAAWLAAGLVAALLPLVVRNAVVGAPLLSSTTRAPFAFVIGNAPDASPVGAVVPESAGRILAASDYRVGATIVETLRAHH